MFLTLPQLEQLQQLEPPQQLSLSQLLLMMVDQQLHPIPLLQALTESLEHYLKRGLELLP
jgi:hypothetical protein